MANPTPVVSTNAELIDDGELEAAGLPPDANNVYPGPGRNEPEPKGYAGKAVKIGLTLALVGGVFGFPILVHMVIVTLAIGGLAYVLLDTKRAVNQAKKFVRWISGQRAKRVKKSGGPELGPRSPQVDSPQNEAPATDVAATTVDVPAADAPDLAAADEAVVDAGDKLAGTAGPDYRAAARTARGLGREIKQLKVTPDLEAARREVLSALDDVTTLANRRSPNLAAAARDAQNKLTSFAKAAGTRGIRIPSLAVNSAASLAQPRLQQASRSRAERARGVGGLGR